MCKTTDLINKYNIYPKKHTRIKSIKIIKTEQESYVIKQKKRSDKSQVYQYLLSRSYNHFPAPVNNIAQDSYEIYPFIEEVFTPKEQKAIDMIYLISLLHNKTTFYKEIDLDEIKSFYEETATQLEYLSNYYNDLQNAIENNIYMSPSEYLLIRNISKIYYIIYFCKQCLEDWYYIVSKKKKERYVMLHNNVELSHFIVGEKPCLISWDQAKTGIPIYDFYHFYQKNYLDFDFVSLLQIYESKYPLLDEEKNLLFLLLSMPKKIVLGKNEFKKCEEISNYLLYLEKTNELISKQNTKKSNK